jgi:Na+-transporting methylmalonyl-CoA/oxaloacetate decarboxylase gamma subunit
MIYLLFAGLIVWLTFLSIKIVVMKAEHKAAMAALVAQYHEAMDIKKGKQFAKGMEHHSELNLTITPAVGEQVLQKLKDKADGSTSDSGTN